MKSSGRSLKEVMALTNTADLAREIVVAASPRALLDGQGHLLEAGDGPEAADDHGALAVGHEGSDVAAAS